MPRWWLPDQWTFVDEIPKTSVGKFDKKVMRAAYADGDYTVQQHATAQVSGSNEAVAELADRLDGVLEELTDMALDALRLASAGRPRFGRDGGGPRPGAAHPQGPPGARALRGRPARSDPASARDPLDDGAD